MGGAVASSGERRWRKDVRPDYSVRSIGLGARLQVLLIDHPDGLSLDELTRRAGASKTSVYRALATLAMHGFVDPVSPELYRVGPRMLLPFTTHVDLLVHRTRPHLEALSEQLPFTVALGMLDASAVTVLAVVYGRSALQVPGEREPRIPLHSNALGKVLAATMGDEEVRSILRVTGLPARTSRTISDADALVEELERIRRRGWAVEDREHDDELRGVAVAVPGRRVVAGLSFIGPAEALPDEELDRVALLLRDHADHILRSPGGED